MNSINPVAPQDGSGTGTGSTSGSGLPSSQNLNNMFLQLLVAQLQNQSPLDPMDPSQFVGQLAQFSELSEVTQIEQTLQAALPTSSSTSGGNPPSGGGTGGTGNSAPHQTGAPVPDAMLSSAVAAARAAVPTAKTSSVPPTNNSVQGVF
jgi:flagellar basal-body rod modification protein FlgD